MPSGPPLHRLAYPCTISRHENLGVSFALQENSMPRAVGGALPAVPPMPHHAATRGRPFIAAVVPRDPILQDDERSHDAQVYLPMSFGRQVLVAKRVHGCGQQAELGLLTRLCACHPLLSCTN